MLRYEFQLRQAIHTHMLWWVEKSISELIREHYIQADLPDPEKEPALYELVQQHQIHTCQPHLCIMRSGEGTVPHPYTKGFPQPLSDQTHHHGTELRYHYRCITTADQYIVPYNAHLLMVWQAQINV